MPLRSRRKRRAIVLLTAAWAMASAACGGGDETPVVDGVLDRETFIEVYVDLRDAAIRTPDLTVSDEVRDAVLARHGVDEESLLAFVEAYGSELDFMNDLWAEVERRVEELPPVPREASGSGA